MLLIDASASTRFGSVRQLKSALAAELGALLAFSAIRNNDKVGLVIFTDRIELALPPRKGTRHVLRVIRVVLTLRRGTGHNSRGVGIYNGDKRRSVVFVLSDLDRCRTRLGIAARRRRDRGRARRPAERGSRTSAWSSWKRRRRYVVGERRPARNLAEGAATPRRADRWLHAANVDAIMISTDRPYTEALLRFFRMRERRQ
jgi:uncharacterized protein (DUF58 family)